MDLVRDLISLGRNIREDVKIKVRQPLSEILLDVKVKDLIGDFDLAIQKNAKWTYETCAEESKKYQT